MEKETWMKIAIILIFILAILSTIFLIRPAITGYSIYSDIKKSNLSVDDYSNDLQLLKNQLSITKTNASTCQAITSQVLSELVLLGDKNIQCAKQLEKESSLLETTKASCDLNKKSTEEKCALNLASSEQDKNVQLDALRKELDSMNSELSSYKTSYLTVVKNAAQNICCKAKVDNSNINSYTITNNKIVCVIDGENIIQC